jgi:hypothetical protein
VSSPSLTVLATLRRTLTPLFSPLTSYPFYPLQHLESIIVWPVAEGAAVEDADEDAQPSPKTGDKRVNGHE